MAKTFDSLTNDAETIRTNTLPDSNTAALVGQMLRDIIDKVKEVNTSSSGAITSIKVAPSADANGVQLFFTMKAGESTSTVSAVLPNVDTAKAGVMTPAQLAQITNSLNSMSQTILNISNSSTSQDKAIAALQTALTDETKARQTADGATLWVEFRRHTLRL